MAAKKSLVFVLWFAVCVQVLPAQWKDEVAGILRGTRDYRAAVDLLLARLEKMDAADKPDAAGLLAFCYSRRNDSANETRWIGEYFETYRSEDSGFAYLDLISQAEAVAFLSQWKSRYPFIPELAMIAGVGDNPIVIQGILPLVVDITCDALFKFSDESSILKAGLFKAGPNILSLDANDLFLRPGHRTFFLELKAERFMLRKEIDLDVTVQAPFAETKKTPVKRTPVTYRLSLYVGDELLMTSQKTEYPVSLKVDTQANQNPFGFKPDYYVNRDKPGINSVSILSAVALLYQLVQDLMKKKDSKAEPPKIKKVQEMTISYKQKDSEGNDRETKISLKLKTKNVSSAATAS